MRNHHTGTPCPATGSGPEDVTRAQAVDYFAAMIAAHRMLTPVQQAEYTAWQAAVPRGTGNADWPGWADLIGPAPWHTAPAPGTRR